MGARTSWGTIPPKTASQTPAQLPAPIFFQEGPSRGRAREEDPAHSPSCSAKPASLGGLPHWGERWVVTPPYSVHGNAEGESRLETPESLLEREVGLQRMN